MTSQLAESTLCAGPRTVHTIGHSTRTIAAFVELLSTHRIELLVDVRRWPKSQRHPHFNREALSAALDEKGIAYLWRQDLGGFRKAEPNSLNTAWRVATFRAYADFMLTECFERIMNELDAIAIKQRIAVMCAEAVPWRCHRQLLADAFFVRKLNVCHIMDDGCHEHKLPAFARPQGVKIYYPGSV
jgi:uncharacterized protein (DUF488 family)